MAHFQDSGLFGISGRTLWVSVAVAGIVVGLFFIPSAVKFMVSNKSSKATQHQQAQTLSANTAKPSAAEKVASSTRGSLSPQVLQGISSTLDNAELEPPVKSQKKKAEAAEARVDKPEGFFSGWDFKVKAGRGSVSPVIPAGIALDRLSSRDAQTFFKRSRSQLTKYQGGKFAHAGVGREAISAFLSNVDVVIKGVPRGGDEEKELASTFRTQHVATLRALAASGADRGALLEWLSIPLVQFVDGSSGVNATKKVTDVFTPRVVLRSLTIRQKGGSLSWNGRQPQAYMAAEVAVRGSDVSTVGIFAGGKALREIRLPRADTNGYRVFRVRGDATGVWSFIAKDKYGARSYQKNYAFYPRVYRFPQKRDGTFDVAFRPGSAPNSLDRFFFVGASGGSLGSAQDSVMAKF